MQQNIEIEVEETTSASTGAPKKLFRPAVGWLKTLGGAAAFLLSVALLPIKILLRPVVERVAARVRKLRENSLVVTAAVAVVGAVVVWMAFIACSTVAYQLSDRKILGPKGDNPIKEVVHATGRNTSFWLRESAANVEDGDIGEAMGDLMKAAGAAPMPNIASRTGNALGHFFK